MDRGGTSDGDRPAVHVASVYFCPDGERIGVTTPSTNFHLAAETTFFEILQGALVVAHLRQRVVVPLLADAAAREGEEHAP